jgi:hypothetical protein
MKKHTFLYFVAATLALGLTGALMKGGPRTGSLGGEVTDPSGAVVPGAKILVSSAHWWATFSTGETGQYVVTGLAPGMYEVAVSSESFAPFERAGLVVSAGDKTEMDASLRLAILKQEITVTADASPIDPSHPDDPAVAPTYAGK